MSCRVWTSSELAGEECERGGGDGLVGDIILAGGVGSDRVDSFSRTTSVKPPSLILVI